MPKRRNAWHTPDETWSEAGTSCRPLFVPDSLMPYFMGALQSLTELWNWEKVSDTGIEPQEAVAVFAEAIHRMTVEPCGGEMILRQNPTSPCVLEFSLDGGLVWTQFADLSLCVSTGGTTTDEFDTGTIRENPTTGELEYSPDSGTTWIDIVATDLTGPATPPLKVVPGANNDAKKCLASTRARDLINEYYRAWFGVTAANLATTIQDVNRFLRDINLALVNFLYGEYQSLVLAAELLAQDFDEEFTAPELTSTAKDDLLCLLFEHSSVSGGGIVTFDFQAVVDNLVSTLGINPGVAVQLMLATWGENGLNAAGSTSITDTPDDCSECGAETPCSRTWDLSNLTDVTIIHGAHILVSGDLAINGNNNYSEGSSLGAQAEARFVYGSDCLLSQVSVQTRIGGNGANNGNVSIRIRTRRNGVQTNEYTQTFGYSTPTVWRTQVIDIPEQLVDEVDVWAARVQASGWTSRNVSLDDIILS